MANFPASTFVLVSFFLDLRLLGDNEEFTSPSSTGFLLEPLFDACFDATLIPRQPVERNL